MIKVGDGLMSKNEGKKNESEMQILFIQQTYWELMVKKLFDPLFGSL